MKRTIQSFIGLSAVTITLSSCSLLGTRQQSTKLDLEGDSITQAKVLPGSVEKTPLGDAAKTKADAQQADLSGGKTVFSETQFLHKTINAMDYVDKNKINFWQIADKETLIKATNSSPLPADLDRASYFFGLGGKLSGDLAVVEATDDVKEKLKIVDQAVDEIKGKMVTADPTCQDTFTSITAIGQVNIKLDDTYIATITKNAKISESETLFDRLKADYFKGLSDDTKNQITGSFDPNLGTLQFNVGNQFEICPGDKPQVYVFDMGKFQQIQPADIKVTDDGGKKKYEVTLTKLVSPQDLQNFKGEDNGNVVTLSSLKLNPPKLGSGLDAGDVAHPVFSDTQEHKQVSVFTFYILPAGSSASNTANPSTTSPTSNNSGSIPTTFNSNAGNGGTSAAPSNIPTTTGGLTSPVNTNNSGNNSGTVTLPPTTTGGNVPSTRSNTKPTKGKNTTSTIGVPESLKPNDNNNSTNAAVTANNSSKAQVNTPPASIAKVAPVVAAFSKSKYVAFDPRLTGVARSFYKNGVYTTGEHNAATSNYWKNNNSKYINVQNGSLSDSDVNTACAPYEFQRTLNFKTSISAFNDTKTTNYLNTGKTYAGVLADQISGDVDAPSLMKPGILSDIVTAALNIPSNLTNQHWAMKICFSPTKGYAAYWSSDETKNDYSYLASTHAINAVNSNQTRWIKASTSGESSLVVPSTFNGARKSMSPTMFTIKCKKENPNQCAAVFQIAVKRAFEPARIMAYLDLSKITGLSRSGVLDGLYDGFTSTTYKNPDGSVLRKEPKTNRLTVFVYGGFEFDPTSTSTATIPATYLTLKDLFADGYISSTDLLGSYESNVAATITYDGAMTEFYINVQKSS